MLLHFSFGKIKRRKKLILCTAKEIVLLKALQPKSFSNKKGGRKKNKRQCFSTFFISTPNNKIEGE